MFNPGTPIDAKAGPEVAAALARTRRCLMYEQGPATGPVARIEHSKPRFCCSPDALLTASFSCCLPAGGRPAATETRAPADARPPLRDAADNPADEPQVTITCRGEDKVEDLRIRG